MGHDNMGARMKAYEVASELVLPARLPVILRLDGNSFHRFTQKHEFNKPFDERFDAAMNAAATTVLDYCAGGDLAYLQSDEMTILLQNDQTINTDPFLANRTQKLTSLTAAKASVAFNAALAKRDIDASAVFDCRVFVVPPHEVQNVFLWRQFDAFKNCISAYAYYGLKDKYGRKTAQKMLHKQTTNERQELIYQELGVNPNDLPTAWRRGRCIYRENYEVLVKDVIPPPKYEELLDKGHVEPNQMTVRSKWKVDTEIPRFDEDPSFIARFASVKKPS